MNWREFIASIIDSAAWPATVATSVVLLRGQLRLLLEVPIKRLKAGPFELEWEHTAEQVAEAIAAGSETDEAPAASAAIALDVARLERLARQVPTVAVGKGYGLVERRLEELLAARGIVTSRALYAMLGPLIADETLSATTVQAIEGLRDLRDVAAHDTGSGLAVTVEQALGYVALVSDILRRLQAE